MTTKDHFTPDGDMKLKCWASIGTVYWQSNVKSAEGFKHKRASLGTDMDRRDSYLPGNGLPRTKSLFNFLFKHYQAVLATQTPRDFVKLSGHFDLIQKSCVIIYARIT